MTPGRAFRAVPVISIITAVTAMTGIAQFVHPSLVMAWRRDSSGLSSGQWW
jgi:hypothetical protein